MTAPTPADIIREGDYLVYPDGGRTTNQISIREPNLSPADALRYGFPDSIIRQRWPFTYLAVPYSHRNKDVQQLRFESVTRAAAWLMSNYGWNVLSPITHSHPLHVLGSVPGDWTFWKQVDTEFLQCSNRIIVFTLPGWRESTGVSEEQVIAEKLGLPKQYLNLYDGEYRLEYEPGPDNIIPLNIV